MRNCCWKNMWARRFAPLAVSMICAVEMCMAADGATQGVRRLADGGNLPLSKVTSMRLSDGEEMAVTPLWETDLNNLDSYQDNASIAVSGNVVYLCVNYVDPFEDGSGKENLIIRCFSAKDGSEMQPLTIAVPEKLRKTSYSSGDTAHGFVIGNDNFGNILLLSFHPANSSAGSITLIPVERGELEDLQLDYADCLIHTIESYGKYTKSVASRIDRITGDIASGNYTVMLYLNWDNKPTDADLTEYAVIEVVDNKIAKFESSSLNLANQLKSVMPDYQWSKNSRPEIHRVPVEEKNLYVVTAGEVSSPMLFSNFGNNALNLKDRMATGHVAAPVVDNKVCCGFYTFLHGNKIMAAYPSVFSKEKNASQFYVAEWKDPEEGFSTLGQSRVALPETPFVYPQKTYYVHYRHAMTSRAVDSDELTEWERPEGDNTPVTDLFVCAPGSGIAAYRLSPLDHATGVALYDNMAQPVLSLEGNMLVASNAGEGERLVVTDMSGRTVYSARWTGDPVSTERFGRGVYVASFGDARLKIAVR